MRQKKGERESGKRERLKERKRERKRVGQEEGASLQEPKPSMEKPGEKERARERSDLGVSLILPQSMDFK